MAVNGLALSPAGATSSGRPVTFDIDGSVVLSTPNGDVPFPMHGIASGTVNGNSVELPIAGSSFDSGSGVFNGLAVTVQPAFTSAFGGTLDASSGAVDFAGAITVYVSVPRIGVNDCPFGPVFVDLTGTNYNSATGTANLSDNQAIIPAVPPSPACGGGGVAPIINSTLGLPAQVQVTSTVTSTPRIVNHMVKGNSVYFQNDVASANRTFRWESFDNVVKTNTTDPRNDGATLRVITAQSDTSIALPPSGWKKAGSAFQYKAGNDKVKVNLSSGKLVVVVKGSAAGVTFTANPGTVKTVLSLGNESYCAQFGGGRRYIAGQKFVARNAPAPAACPA